MEVIDDLKTKIEATNEDFLKLFTEYTHPEKITDRAFGSKKAILSRCQRMHKAGCLDKARIDNRIKYKWNGKKYESRYNTIASNYNERRNAHAVDINNEFLRLFTDWKWPKSIKDEKYGAVFERCYRLEEEGCLKRKKVNNNVYFMWTGKEYVRTSPPGRYAPEPVMPSHKFASNDKYWAEKYKEQQRLISAERRGVRTNNYVSGNTLSMIG